MRFALAIDDEPQRYTEVSSLLLQQGVVLLCTDQYTGVELFLQYGVRSILLDHDLGVLGDTRTITSEILCERSIPCMVVSANPVAAGYLERTLQDYAVPVQRCPVGVPGWASRVVSFVLSSFVPGSDVT